MTENEMPTPRAIAQELIKGKKGALPMDDVYARLMDRYRKQIDELAAQIEAAKRSMSVVIEQAWEDTGQPLEDMVLYNVYDAREGFILRTPDEIARLIAQGVIQPPRK